MDVLIIVVLLIGAVIGFCQGAFKQIANFFGVVAGLVLATMMYQRFGEYLSDKMNTSGSFGNTMAFILIAIIVPVALGFLATLLTKLFSEIRLGFLNRLAGAVIGVVCYAMLMSFVFNFMDFFKSAGGMELGKLEQRPPLYYKVKHASQILVPDVIIVTDSAEVADGEEPHYGLMDKLSGMLSGDGEK